MNQKIISCKASETERKIQPLLDQGWTVINMVAEHVSISVAATGNMRDYITQDLHGQIVFILEQ